MDVFEEKNLSKIFKCLNEQQPYKLISRESNTLEFKESFSKHALAKYAKTMAAFANRDGGYLIFGVKDKPRTVVGLKDSSFDEYDDEKIVEKLNEYFSPEITFLRTTIKYLDLNIGIIYVYQSISKPIVCTKSIQNNGSFTIREGAIYYRYSAKSSEIKYSDLRIMLENVKENERKLWMQTITKIAKIGVNNLSLINLKDGKLNVNCFGKNKELFVDEKVISSLKLVKEGHFVETDGEPALKLIGEIKGITGALVNQEKIIKQIEPTYIHEKYLLETFLNQTGTQSPMSYIEAFCRFSVKYLPFYYFVYLIQQNDKTFDKTKLKQEISKITEDCKMGKTYLLQRIKSDENFKEEKLTGSDLELKKKYLNLYNDKNTKLADIPKENIEIQLKMILNISDKERIKNLIIPLLSNYLNDEYETHKTLLRRAISYIDKILYKEQILNF
ncbi:aAA-4 family protein [Brachyspira sp. CAG:484]|nr:aAA-4 family protein [Brachyspira sp. CAG:484]